MRELTGAIFGYIVLRVETNNSVFRSTEPDTKPKVDCSFGMTRCIVQEVVNFLYTNLSIFFHIGKLLGLSNCQIKITHPDATPNWQNRLVQTVVSVTSCYRVRPILPNINEVTLALTMAQATLSRLF